MILAWLDQIHTQTHTHTQTALANNPALWRNMHCKHSWLIADKLLNLVNNQIILPQYKQRWQRQKQKALLLLLLFFTYISRLLFPRLFWSWEGNEWNANTGRREPSMPRGRANGRRAKRREDRQMGAGFGDRWGCRQGCVVTVGRSEANRARTNG